MYKARRNSLQSCSTLHQRCTVDTQRCSAVRVSVKQRGGGLRSGGGRDMMRARQTLDSNAVFSSSLCSPPYFFTYRGTSLIRKRPPLGRYSRAMPRALW